MILPDMKAWLIDKLEGLQHLRIADVPDPMPGPDEVVLRVEYAALNPADRYLAENQYPAKPKLPHILGRDGAGAIVAVGANVTQFRVGETGLLLRSEVGVNKPGTFAEKVVVPVESLTRVPDGWSTAEGAAAVLVYLTAYQAITQWDDLAPGGVMLVTGISGGVGVASIHLGNALGHTVIGLSRNKSKWPQLKQLGAAEIFDPADKNWRKDAKAWLGDERRVNLAIDNIGGPLLNEVLDTLGMWGKVSLVGRLAGPTPNFNSAALFFRRLRMGGVAMSSWTSAQSQEAWRAVVELMRKTGARPQIDSTYAFDQLPQAFARLETGPLGKVLVRVAS